MTSDSTKYNDVLIYTSKQTLTLMTVYLINI